MQKAKSVVFEDLGSYYDIWSLVWFWGISRSRSCWTKIKQQTWYCCKCDLEPMQNNTISRRWYLYLFWHTTYICLTNAWFSYKRDCKQLNIPTKDGIIFRKFQGQVYASLVCVNVIMKRGWPSCDGEDDNATPLHKHTTYFNTPRLKTLSSTTAATFPQTPPPHTQSLQVQQI